MILIFCRFIKYSALDSPPAWGRSRYIIDNRRNALFSKKISTAIFRPQKYYPEESSFRFDRKTFKGKLFPLERYQKELTAEASISEPKFYQKLEENSLPRKIIKSYEIAGGLPKEFGVGIFGNQKNTTGVLDPHNFVQSENEIVTTTEKMLTWMSRSSTDPNLQKTSNGEFETTVSYPWELSKTEEGNQIDTANEKHVYETRIETVSYHQEVIFNPPDKQNWYRERDHESKIYETPEENYEEPEQNYEESEKHYEEDEEMNVMPNEDAQSKFGYVVEGTNYRKYRVEERTADGFIVGEYGVVSHDDGTLRGVRYTADSSTNPNLIYETLIKFLSL